MTDRPTPTEDEILQDEAKRAAPPEPVPGAENLPADVPDGHVEDPA